MQNCEARRRVCVGFMPFYSAAYACILCIYLIGALATEEETVAKSLDELDGGSNGSPRGGGVDERLGFRKESGRGDGEV